MDRRLNKYESKLNDDKPIEAHILRAWERCSALELDRDDIKGPIRYNAEDIDKLLEENKELIRISKPFMETLYSFVRGSGFVVMLTDNNACILNVIGDKEIINKPELSTDFEIGVIWQEQYAGNTAMSTALYEEESVQVLGDQHYCNRYKIWACSAAPIRKDGKIIGTITARGYLKNTHPHTLGMVLGVAKSIENQMVVENATREILHKNKYQSAIMECINDGFLTIDKKGILTYINKLGADILDIDYETAVGKHVGDLVDFDPIILNVIKTGKGYTDKEFIIKSNKSGVKYHFIKTAMPIRDGEGNIVGAVDNFRKIKRVHKMVRDLVGNYGKFTFDDIIGDSPKMKECIRLAKIASKSSSRVLIYGESGTGKELLVQSIHNASIKRNESLVSINCAAIPSELIESELFGYESGAFTGALKKGQTGKFELANGGTIFLDEIGDMPLHMQGKLLRVLQEKQITRVGGKEVIDIDVRIISATNKDLLSECRKGNFREDLYYRLNVFNIVSPPLRQRKEDIDKLIKHFISKSNDEIGTSVKGISQEAVRYLIDYDWPGNVRELENVIERAVNLCATDTIQAKDLSGNVRGEKDGINNTINIQEMQEDKENMRHEIYSMEEIERKAIEKTLRVFDGNISQSAKVLKISRNTLYNKLEKYGIG